MLSRQCSDHSSRSASKFERNENGSGQCSDSYHLYQGTLAINDWNHFCMVYEMSKGVTAYLNGTVDVADQLPTRTIPSGNGHIVIGQVSIHNILGVGVTDDNVLLPQL
eukprot:sb/3477537/